MKHMCTCKANSKAPHVKHAYTQHMYFSMHITEKLSKFGQYVVLHILLLSGFKPKFCALPIKARIWPGTLTVWISKNILWLKNYPGNTCLFAQVHISEL